MNVALSLPASRAESFRELVAAAKGRHPIELLADLLADPSPDARRLALDASATRTRPRDLPQGDGLALPHVLDAEWRFDPETARMLLARAVAATQSGETILLLGVPTVILAATESDADRRFAVSWEANIIGAGLAARIADDSRFRDPAAANCAAAIVDPPWYPPVFAGLLGQAAAACRLGGVILVGTPPLGVRPTSETERRELLAAAAGIGLALLTTTPEALTYRTPAFEAAAMEAAGLHLWLPAWRRGDLLVFRRDQLGGAPVLPRAPLAFEVTLAGVRLRLLADPIAASDRIVPLLDGEVFPSVSTRAPGRARANLWTSGNRAFTCPPAATLRALQALAAQHDLWPKGLNLGRTESGGSDVD